jgi:hypothetical protein
MASLKKLIQRRMKAGKYATPEDVVAAAMLTLDQQERFGEFAPGEMELLLAEGERSIRSEGTLDGDRAFRARQRRRRDKLKTKRL